MSQKTGRKGGFQKREPKEFDEEVVQIDRVTRVVKGGRKLRFRATVVIGNRKGKVGVGTGKSHEVTGAIQKAIAKAKKDIFTVKLNETTIPHDVRIKYKASKILLMPAAPGTGVIAGGPIRKVLELAGVKDILSKSFGTTNKLNNTKATFEALKLMKTTPFMERKKLNKPQAEAPKKATEKQEEAKTKDNKTTKEVKKTEKPAADKKTTAKAPAKKS